MTGGFTEDHSAEVVAASFSGTGDERLRQLLTGLVERPAATRTGRRTSISSSARRVTAR